MIFPYLKKPVKNIYPDSDPFGVKRRTDFFGYIRDSGKLRYLLITVAIGTEIDNLFFMYIRNGGEAMTVFPRIQYMAPEEQQVTRHNLLEYCKPDTCAMVKVWEELVRVS